MQREIHKWYSPSLFKEMEIVVYGHYGTPLLMFPTAGADFLEYERFKLIESKFSLSFSINFRYSLLNLIQIHFPSHSNHLLNFAN